MGRALRRFEQGSRSGGRNSGFRPSIFRGRLQVPSVTSGSPAPWVGFPWARTPYGRVPCARRRRCDGRSGHVRLPRRTPDDRVAWAHGVGSGAARRRRTPCRVRRVPAAGSDSDAHRGRQLPNRHDRPRRLPHDRRRRSQESPCPCLRREHPPAGDGIPEHVDDQGLGVLLRPNHPLGRYREPLGDPRQHGQDLDGPRARDLLLPADHCQGLRVAAVDDASALWCRVRPDQRADEGDPLRDQPDRDVGCGGGGRQRHTTRGTDWPPGASC